MPTGQQYATNVPQAQVTAGISPSTTSFGVNSLSGWPTPPYTAVLDIGTSSQEPIDVITVSGNTITLCNRAIDGTTALSHASNATLTHGNIGRDFREARAHIDASGPTDSAGHSVHGLAAASSVVVGTNDTQTLTNKTMSGATFLGTTQMGSGNWNGTGQLSENTVITTTTSFAGLTGANTQTSRFAGTTSSGPPVSGTFVTGDSVFDATGNLWYCTSGGTPGTWVPVGGRAKIGSTALTGASTSIAVPSWATSLYGIWTARSSNAANGGYVNIQLNTDSGNNYTWEQVLGSTNAVSGQNAGGAVNIIHLGAKTAASDTANYFGSGSFTIVNAQSTSLFKVVSAIAEAPGSVSGGFAGVHGGTWLNTAAVNSVTLLPDAGNFVTGSMFTLYGLV